jgi:RHS repeat-associated protein
VPDASGETSETIAGMTVVYTYDANGNRLQQTAGTPATGTYDDQDRLISYGGTTYAYNKEGQCFAQTPAGQTTIYAHDEFGWRRVILPDDTQIDYLLDGLGRRVGKLVDGTLKQGWLCGPGPNPVAELDDTGAVVSRFVYASRPDVPDYIVKGNVTYRIITDQVGSVRLVVNTATGAVVQRLDYDEFGRVLLDTNPGFQPFGFAGGLADTQTTLLQIGGRDYDPQVGRWITPAPLVTPDRTNRYVYADNDPINRSETGRP